MQKISFLDALQSQVVVFDGAMGTNLQEMNLKPQQFGGEKYFGCNDYLVITYPEAVEKVHRSFLEVGVDVIETCTFRANRITLAEYGLQSQVTQINQSAADLARQLAQEYSQQTGLSRFVAGSIGPSGKLPSMNDPELSNLSFDDLADVFREQAIGLIKGGVDLLLLETAQDILEVKAAIIGIQQAFEQCRTKVPIQAQVTLDITGRMLLGTDISAVLAILEGFPIHVIGINCSTGPDLMREPIEYLGTNSNLPVSCIPNAGLPINVNGQAIYPMKPEQFSDLLVEFVKKYGVGVVGGCCGTTPSHLKLLVNKLKGLNAPIRKSKCWSRLSSSIRSISMQQNPPPFLIGERLNTQGSREFKTKLLEMDNEGILEIARRLVDGGAHGLDLCVALTEKGDETSRIRSMIRLLAPVIDAPFVIDATEYSVIEAALKTAPGRCLINSTNLESGEEKANQIFQLARKYNAAVIALTIDEKGMAKTAENKLSIARRIYDLAVKNNGLSPCDLVFDPLTFTLATGDPEFSNSVLETIKGLRLIKGAFPEVLTSLGISNVSFGFTPPTRAVLNSVFLHHCVKAGLDMAIVNPEQIIPYGEIPIVERNLADDLILNRTENALHKLIEYYRLKPTHGSKTASISQSTQLSKLSLEERIQYRILHRLKAGMEEDIEKLIYQAGQKTLHEQAIYILNSVLLPAMKVVGEKFGSRELILPFVLQSAEIMQLAVHHLEKFLEHRESPNKGTLILATVYGDVHDIGKNLVKTIISNNGYRVIDLGKQVPVEIIISKAVEMKADAIGLSALLVTTSKQMQYVVNELERRGHQIPVLIGGAAINKKFGSRIQKTDSGNHYKGGVFYCRDAFEGLSAMEQLTDKMRRDDFIANNHLNSAREDIIQIKATSNIGEPYASSLVVATSHIPIPPFWGPRFVKRIPLEMVFQLISKKDLFRLSWGGRNTRGKDWEKMLVEFEARFTRMCKEAINEGWLKPMGIYGYWPAQSQNNDLLVYEPNATSGKELKVLARFHFPRQSSGEYLCLSDYFCPVESGKMDVAAFQVITVGPGATNQFEKLQEANNFTEAYYSHGLAVQTTEAAAEYLHRHILQELGVNKDQGRRYSWGYPAIPDLSDHKLVFQLLPVEEMLGVKLTSAYQLVPEQSTAAIIVHHPSAKYFNIAETRIQQQTS